MKPAEELAKEIKSWVDLFYGSPGFSQEFLNMIVVRISRDRLAVRKKCAEVVRSKMIRGDYKDCPAGWMNNAYTIFAKAIEEMEL